MLNITHVVLLKGSGPYPKIERTACVVQINGLVKLSFSKVKNTILTKVSKHM